jgi:hypothetical protein
MHRDLHSLRPRRPISRGKLLALSVLALAAIAGSVTVEYAQVGVASTCPGPP